MSEAISKHFRLYWQKKRWEVENRSKVPFKVTPQYLQQIWTGICPIFQTPLTLPTTRGAPYHSTPQLDRLLPSLGYVEGNVSWLSPRANLIKSDADGIELIRIGLWLLEQTNEKPANRSH